MPRSRLSLTQTFENCSAQKIDSVNQLAFIQRLSISNLSCISPLFACCAILDGLTDSRCHVEQFVGININTTTINCFGAIHSCRLLPVSLHHTVCEQSGWDVRGDGNDRRRT